MPLIDADLRRLLTPSSPVLAFVPGPIEFERFVLEGAFEELAQTYDLHVAVPEGQVEALRAAAPAALGGLPRVPSADPGTRARSRLLKVLPAGTWPHARRVTSYARGVRVLPARLRRRLRSWDAVLQHAAHRRPGSKGGGAGTFHAVGGNGPDGLVPLLEALKPLFCILPAGQGGLFARDALAACKAAGVGCVLVQSDWTPVPAAVEISRTADFVACWSVHSATATRRAHGVPASRVAVLGAPHLFPHEPASAAAIAAVRRALGLDSDERLVLFGGARRQFDDADVLRRLERIAGSGRIGRAKIVYRPDPCALTPKLERRFAARRWQHVILDPGSRPGGATPGASDTPHLALLLSTADAVIAPLSPLLIDALRFGKPAMAIAFGNGEPDLEGASLETTPLAEIRRSRAVLWCDNASRLARDAAALLRPDTTARMAAARTRLLPGLLTTAPGNYARRLSTFCRDVVEPRARTLRYKAGGRRRATISHTYGAHDIAARYCRAGGRELRVPGFWMHGWIPEYHNVHPALIALHKRAGLERPDTGPETLEPLDTDTPQFVSRDDQARYLAAHGYTRVAAIGLPIVYLPRPAVRRVPGSLLVLPPHGHRSHGPGDTVAEELAAAIAALQPRFTQIVVGLTEDDVVRGEWVGAFRAHDLDVVVTAQQSDPDTLARLVAILCSFEYVTTNGFGSQIAYAAYCGAKVSIYGPFANFTPDRMASVHALRLFPDLLDTALELCSERALRRQYPFLFVDPDKALAREAWGAQEVGEPSRLPAPDLARAFGWPAARPLAAAGAEWNRESPGGAAPLRG